MAYTDEQVEQWFKNNLDASEVEIVRAMQVSGVDPAQVSRVTGADPGYVASRFEAFTTAGPPSPAVSPVVANPISLTPEGTASLGQPTNVSSPANVFSPADYGPPSPIFDPAAEIQRMQAQRVEAERLKQIELERPIVDPRPQPYVDTAAQNLLGQFDQAMDAAMASGDYANVANVMKEAEGLYGPATYSTVADYLNTNPRYEGLRGQVGIDPSIEGGAAYTPDNLRAFISSIPAPVDPGIAGALPGGPAGALPAGPAGSVPVGPDGSGSVQKQAQQHRQAGCTNQPTLHIGKKGKHLLVATMLNQESVLMVEYLALGQNSSSNKVIRFQALKHGLEV
jgi:hypothetical protein